MTESTSHSDKGGGGNYWRFMAMVSTSTVIMFFLMYANSFDMDDVFWSETRFWMMFVMGAMMMVVMLLFMWGMYKDRTKNFIILGVGALVFQWLWNTTMPQYFGLPHLPFWPAVRLLLIGAMFMGGTPPVTARAPLPDPAPDSAP